MLLLVFLDEVWGLTRRTGCSVIGRVVPGRPGGPDRPAVPPTTELGQTMDLPAWTQGRARVLRIIPGDAPTALVLAVTVTSLILQIRILGTAAAWTTPWLNGVVSLVLLGLAALLVVFAARALRRPPGAAV